jgi:hypothetical protein
MSHLIAKEIVSFCTSCKRDLMHVIEAVDGDKIVRVHCKTCKRQHAYRPPRESEAQGGLKKPGPSPKKRKTASLFDEWEKIMEATKDFPAKAYDVHERFVVGENVDHAKFGIGVVRRLMDPNKMVVLFKDGTKVLVRGTWQRT